MDDFIQLDGKTTSFEELWMVYEKFGHEIGWGVEDLAFVKKVFYAGAFGGIGVLSNRLAELPGKHDKTTILQGISNEVVKATQELFNVNRELRQERQEPTIQ